MRVRTSHRHVNAVPRRSSPMCRRSVSLLFLGALSAAQAGNFEDGVRHLDAKAYVKAAAAFRLAAAEGNAGAERQLGFMYYKGMGFKQGDVEAVTWFEHAAAHGDLQSQINLGQMYENGLSVAQSDSRSAHWYRMAAEQGDRRSQFRFGEICYLGTGVPQDGAEAVKWWRLAMRIDDHETARMRVMVEAPLLKTPPEIHDEGQRRANAWLAARSSTSSQYTPGTR